MAVIGLHRQIRDSSGPIVLHSPWWIESRWGRAFDILSIRSEGFITRGQDHGVVLARKRDVDVVAQDLEWPNPDDPRELSAQRLQIALLEENAARLRNQLLRASGRGRKGDSQAPGRGPVDALRRLRRRAGTALRSDRR